MLIFDYIVDHFTVERATAIIKLIRLIEDFNVDGTIAKMEELAFMDDNKDTAAVISGINDIIIEDVNYILYSHQLVVLDLTRDIILLHDLADTLKLVTEEYDAKYILDRVNFELSESNTAHEVYAKLVSLVTTTREDDVLENIYSLDDGLITNIHNLLLGKLVEDADILEDKTEEVELYKKFLKGRRHGLVHELLKGGVHVGQYEFASLFVLLEEQLDKLSREDLIFEAISLILISDYEDTTLTELFEKVSRVLGETEAEGKIIHTEMRRAFTTAGMVL